MCLCVRKSRRELWITCGRARSSGVLGAQQQWQLSGSSLPLGLLSVATFTLLSSRRTPSFPPPPSFFSLSLSLNLSHIQIDTRSKAGRLEQAVLSQRRQKHSPLQRAATWETQIAPVCSRGKHVLLWARPVWASSARIACSSNTTPLPPVSTPQ